jgi:hypothetical protein
LAERPFATIAIEVVRDPAHGKLTSFGLGQMGRSLHVPAENLCGQPVRAAEFLADRRSFFLTVF